LGVITGVLDLEFASPLLDLEVFVLFEVGVAVLGLPEEGGFTAPDGGCVDGAVAGALGGAGTPGVGVGLAGLAGGACARSKQAARDID